MHNIVADKIRYNEHIAKIKAKTQKDKMLKRKRNQK